MLRAQVAVVELAGAGTRLEIIYDRVIALENFSRNNAGAEP